MKMAEKEKFYSLGRSQTAQHKRNAQLKIWESSDTNKQPDSILPSRRIPKVKFGESVVFLAAAQSGDIEEVERLIIEEGADVNSQNKDGLTSLHQCCIDDDFDMVQVLVKHRANVDAQDNEGWTPLHAAASCGHDHIVRFLLDSGAFPALVNNEGDTPSDVAEEYEEIRDMITAKVEEMGINVDTVRSVEEAIMLEDANRLKNDGSLSPVMSPGGATPLHVAAAKGYLSVLKVLLCLKSSQMMIDAKDEDGWTPLHAAVYWGNMDAAEELVTNGADLTVKTKSGDTIDDLCEPELTNDLETLRKLDEEHNHRLRRNALSKRVSNRPSLSHSNSREEMSNKHPSPQIVRRRSSKERSMLPHLDMAKEREEREKLLHESTEIVTTNSLTRDLKMNKPTREIEVPAAESNPTPVNQNLASVSSSEAREVAQEDNNSSKEAQNSAKEESVATSQAEPEQPPQTLLANNQGFIPSQESPPSSSPSESPQESPKLGSKKLSPTVSPKSSPKVAKKKPGMSPRMLQRVNLWEAQKTTPKTTGLHPLASSTPTNGGGSGSDSSVAKRFPFQPKTIPQEPSSSSSSSASSSPLGMLPRSQSMDQRPNSSRTSSGLLDMRREDLRHKRGSYDEARLKKQLDLPETNSNGEYKASSLPRSAKIVVKSNAVKENVDYHTKNTSTPKTETPAVSTASKSGATAMATVSSEGHPTSNSLTVENETSVHHLGRDLSREMSVDSTTSNRSTVEESETGRKTRARRTRQSRKATQPVPLDVLEKINMHDREELAKVQSSEPSPPPPTQTNSTTKDLSQSSGEEITSSESSADSTPAQARKGGQIKDNLLMKLSMSAFKPSPRPTPKSKRSHSTPTQPVSPWATTTTSSTNNGMESSSPPQQEKQEQHQTPSVQDSTDQTSMASSEYPSINVTEDQSPSPRPRGKSAARRKPKERRKPTGITVEVGEDEQVPEELSMFVVRKSSNPGGDTSTISDISGHSSYSEDSIADSHLEEELKQIRISLASELDKTGRLEGEVQSLQKELLEVKSRVLELNRKYEDATRAYEQEKREKEQMEMRIHDLENGSKNSQDLKHENQRLKDENSALIRVIGKLSRAPLSHTTS